MENWQFSVVLFFSHRSDKSGRRGRARCRVDRGLQLRRAGSARHEPARRAGLLCQDDLPLTGMPGGGGLSQPFANACSQPARLIVADQHPGLTLGIIGQKPGLRVVPQTRQGTERPPALAGHVANLLAAGIMARQFFNVRSSLQLLVTRHISGGHDLPPSLTLRVTRWLHHLQKPASHATGVNRP